MKVGGVWISANKKHKSKAEVSNKCFVFPKNTRKLSINKEENGINRLSFAGIK